MLSPAVLKSLRGLVGADRVLTDREDLVCYSFDATAGLRPHLPGAVVTPAAREQVVEVLKLCHRHRVPVYPRGSGTNLSGGTVPLAGGIVLSLLDLNRIVEIDPDNLTATVEPGVILQTLNDAVARHGLIYPPDPGTVATCTVGGSAAECSGGLRGLKYGVSKHYIMGLEVVLADGAVVRVGGKTVKNVTGYDLTKLFVGSEGTLGIFTELTLRLIPAPEARRSMVVAFDSLDQAGGVITGIIRSGVIPATLEIMDALTIRTVEAYARVDLPVGAEAVLLIEVDGLREAVERETATVERICRSGGAAELRVAGDDRERDRLWAARRAALPALARVKPTTILEDATVPRSRVPEMLSALQRIAREHSLTIGTFGHAGDGNLHPTILTDARDADEMRRVEAAVDEIFRVALDLGGTLSGEHGIGAAKQRYLTWELGEEGVELHRRIKQALDPLGILNPGKVVGT